MRFAPLSALLAAVFVPGAFASVHVVNGGASNALQAAVNAAANGDTILVHGGHYDRITVNAKGLTFVAEPEQGTLLDGLTITGLATSQVCVVAGFNLASASVDATMIVSNCSGSVRVVGAHVSNYPTSSDDGVMVQSSYDVAFSRCTIEGGSQYPSTDPTIYPVGRGLYASNSLVALYDCSLLGGDGQDGHFVQGFLDIHAGVGGDALQLANASGVFLGRCTLQGGNGGAGRNLDCSHLVCGIAPGTGANGGAGSNCDTSSSLEVFDSLFAGGQKGIGGMGGQCCPQTTFTPGADGIDGPPTVGALMTLSGSCPVLTAPNVVREQATLTLTIQGVPGDTVSLAFADSTRWIADLGVSGVLLFGTPFRRVPLGTIPPSGTLVATLPVASLPPGLDAASNYLQIATRTSAGPLRLGSPSWLTILDSSF